MITFPSSIKKKIIQMLAAIHPKLPMRNRSVTQHYYLQMLGFLPVGHTQYDGYLMVQKDDIELHFFEYKNLDPLTNYGQVYIRTTHIEAWYNWLLSQGVPIHPAGHLQTKPWGQKEFSLLDPDHNLLTFGESV
jgi:hypothetical protein